jgi:oxalate---CoA ligase
VRPRDPVELLVERICADVLGRPWVDVRATLKSLGADGEARRRMLERIARESAIGNVPDAVGRAETIEGVAVALKRTSDVLRYRARAFWARNVDLPPGAGRSPLFFFHGLRGGGRQWLEPMEGLGADQPVYGIAPHVTSGEPVPKTVEAIARDHLRLVRTIQPAGPYLLGGFCNGAVAAFEAASQLERAGVRVSGLLLVAPMLPATYRTGAVAQFIRFAITPFDRSLAVVHKLGLRYRLNRALGRAEPGPSWMRRVERPDAELAQSPDGVLFDVYSAILQAYAPAPLPMPATIFWPRREPRRFRVPSAWAWRRALPGAAIVEIPGGHGSWRSGPAAVATARALRGAIDALVDRPKVPDRDADVAIGVRQRRLR